MPSSNRHFPYYTCYNFKAYFAKDSMPDNISTLNFHTVHKPLNVAVASNIPGNESEVCFMTDKNQKRSGQKVGEALKMLEEVSCK